MSEKRCPDCGENQPIENFYKVRPKDPNDTERHGYCIPCYRARSRAYYNAAKKRGFGPRQLRVRRDGNMRRKYGLSLDELEKMLADQGGVCAICSTPGELKLRGIYVDHDHETGKVRALLCSGCNSMLGYARDHVGILKSAIDYLEAHS